MLEYKRAIKRGVKGEDVRTLQMTLTNLGYFVNGIDGSCGQGMEKAIKQFQSDNKLVVDGSFGRQSYAKLNEILGKNSTQQPLNKPKYYKYGEAHVIEVNPLDLYIDVVKQANNTIKGDFINGSLFGIYKGKMVSISTLVSNGKILSEHLPHDNVKRGTFIVWKDGNVSVEMIDFISKYPKLKDIKFAIGGFNIMPQGKTIRQQIKDEWFDYNGIGYRTWRSMMGYDKSKNKVLIVMSPNTDAEQGQALLKKLGCDIGIGLDSGGSTSGRFCNSLIRVTTRVIHDIIRW